MVVQAPDESVEAPVAAPGAAARDRSTPSRFSRGAVLAAVTVVVLGIGAATWGAVAAVASAHRSAHYVAAARLVAAEPATYHPVAQPVANAVVPAPMGQWTPERGRAIAERALQWLGWPYSFGGGGPDGPSLGVPVDHDSRNDGHVRGFDCSGLVMYAMAPWRSDLRHDAATQYRQVGTWHPSLDSLQPGDLVFWSKDGTIDGIGHVAVYIGDGKVVQAPESGDVVKISPIYAVESGDMGATRPLT